LQLSLNPVLRPLPARFGGRRVLEADLKVQVSWVTLRFSFADAADALAAPDDVPFAYQALAKMGV
jgi:hypothetical protein